MRHIKELWQAVAIYSSMAQFTLISVLGHPYKKETVVLSFGQTCFQLLLAILWNVLFLMTFVYAIVSIVQLIKSWVILVPILGIFCLNFAYGLFKWLINASMFNVLYYSFSINGALFMSLCAGYLILVMLVFLWFSLCSNYVNWEVYYASTFFIFFINIFRVCSKW